MYLTIVSQIRRAGNAGKGGEGSGWVGRGSATNLGADKVGEEFEVEAVCSPPLALRRCSHV